jgi:hypothetical protein
MIQKQLDTYMEEKLTVLPYEINPVKTQVLKVESRML